MNKSTFITAVIMLGIGVGAGYWISSQSMQANTAATEEKKPLYYRNPMDPGITSQTPAQDTMGMDYIPVYADEPKAEEPAKILFYRNPMNPDVTSQVPAKDSMGMDYVPVYAESGSGSDVVGTVKIDPVVVQNIGVRTQYALKKTFGRAIRAVGRVDFDEQQMSRLHPKVEGWIEEIYIDKTGESVENDTILLGIYSPKLVSTQQEYLLALNNLAILKDSPIEEIRKGAEDLVKSARERLELFDVPEHQIKELEETRKIKKVLHIHSPFAGTVIKIGARQGQFVTPRTELYMIVDLKEVWVYADVYEYELPWVREGDKVEMTLASVPGKVFKGDVSYIYPYAESKTRTTKVRMVFQNPDMLLRPDMFAEVNIQSDTRQNAIVIPAEAVIRSGKLNQVFIKRGPGKYEPREVQLGVESGGEVVVLKGINDGDEVVTSAQFLVDSESKLKEATAKMMEALNAEKTGQVKPETNTQPDESEPMDHSTMNMNGADKMDHSKMNMNDMEQLDHSKMNMGGMEQMDQSNMDMNDMEQMEHPGTNMDDKKQMDHGSMNMDVENQGHQDDD